MVWNFWEKRWKNTWFWWSSQSYWCWNRKGFIFILYNWSLLVKTKVSQAFPLKSNISQKKLLIYFLSICLALPKYYNMIKYLPESSWGPTSRYWIKNNWHNYAIHHELKCDNSCCHKSFRWFSNFRRTQIGKTCWQRRSKNYWSHYIIGSYGWGCW